MVFGAKEKQSQYEESDTHFESKNIKQIRPKIYYNFSCKPQIYQVKMIW